MLAALELFRRGYRVTTVEKRPEFTRPIHLHLRPSYLEDIRRISPELHRRLMIISTPIEENERLASTHTEPQPAYPQDRRSSARAGSPCPVWTRLSTPPSRHVRLNHAESLFCQFIHEIEGAHEPRFVIQRGYELGLRSTDSDRYEVFSRRQEGGRIEDLGAPDIVVIAEGGKSDSVRALQLENVRFSYPKYFMSAHIDLPFGPRTRRIDTDLTKLVEQPGFPSTPLSLWASGHGEYDEGTWIVLEVPERLLDQHAEQAHEYFLRGATLLMEDTAENGSQAHLREQISAALRQGAHLARKSVGLPDVEAASKPTFAGTFKFEQQCLRFPAAGSNVVVLGDSAGMGHHALSSGLEMGVLDLIPLGRLCDHLQEGNDPKQGIAEYASTVFSSRLRLLAIGMNEYYPNAKGGRLQMLQRAAEFSRKDPL